MHYHIFYHIFNRRMQKKRYEPEDDGEIEDEDVRIERNRLEQAAENLGVDEPDITNGGHILSIKKLTRTFNGVFKRKKVAVKNITVGIRPGEVSVFYVLITAKKSYFNLSSFYSALDGLA